MLDELFNYGTTLFFVKTALQAVERFAFLVQQLHLDSTSIAVDGEYEGEELVNETVDGMEEPKAIRLWRGYSRDHQPELKQFLANLICARNEGCCCGFR